MPRHIVHISAHYPPYLGGTERVAFEVATMLARRGNTVDVITSTIGYTANFQDEHIINYGVHRMPAFICANVPVIPGLFFKLLTAPQSSIFHIHVVQAFIPEVVLLAAKIRRIPVIAHFHLDVAPSGRFGKLFELYKKTLFPVMLSHATKVIVFSEDQKQLLHTKYDVSLSNIAIIPNGVSDDFFFKQKRILPAKPVLLCVGRLSQQKNIKQLLQALDGISDQVVTYIVGEGELKAELEALSQKLHLQNVHFVGRADGEELKQYYRKANIFVLPSEREGMPLVLLEAMAMGLPIIGTDVIGIQNLVLPGKNGLLVPLRDSKALQNAIASLITSPKMYAQMAKSAQLMAKKYSWHTLVKELEHLYDVVSR